MPTSLVLLVLFITLSLVLVWQPLSLVLRDRRASVPSPYSGENWRVAAAAACETVARSRLGLPPTVPATPQRVIHLGSGRYRVESFFETTGETGAAGRTPYSCGLEAVSAKPAGDVADPGYWIVDTFRATGTVEYFPLIRLDYPRS